MLSASGAARRDRIAPDLMSAGTEVPAYTRSSNPRQPSQRAQVRDRLVERARADRAEQVRAGVGACRRVERVALPADRVFAERELPSIAHLERALCIGCSAGPGSDEQSGDE